MLTRPAAVVQDIDDPDYLPPRELAVQPPARWGRWFRRGALALGVLLLLLVAYLAITAPLSKSLQPITAPSLTLLSAEGRPIARRGSVTDLPVKASELPAHVPRAFLAIEDRRFYEHIGVDPWGVLRAAFSNAAAGGVVEGGSTISQQLAKLSFLSSEQTAARKLQEAILSLWLEAWLDKDEILSRYMSSVYFGDNVYGLRAAASHYFSRRPEQLSIEQAAMLAGLVKAPSRLAPTKNLEEARERGRVVQAAMVDAGMMSKATADSLPPVTLKRGAAKDVPNGTYFADWVIANLEGEETRYGRQVIRTTLEDRLQIRAAQAIRAAGIGAAQVALVSMRPDGRVVAMVGGRSYRQSAFNRVTQAKRQPGSAFKLFVYLAALRAGYTPGSPIEDTPLRIGKWTPDNYESRYRGMISLRDAFAVSSNVAAVRLSERVGRDRVIQAARDLGVTSELERGPTMALGTSQTSLMELTGAFAAVANGSYPVRPRGLPEPDEDAPEGEAFSGQTREMMMQLLQAVTVEGTGRGAALPIPTYGKTGTTQGNRDAFFVGFAGDLVTGVWIGRDDNSPVGDVQGGGLPARIWRNFMVGAVAQQPSPPVAAAPADYPSFEEGPSVPFGTAPAPAPDYDVRDYDVDDSAAPPAPRAPASEEPNFEPAPAREPIADEAPVEDEAPLDREVPPIAAPPPPPEPEEEPAPDEEE